jgi:HTH-type transcriptional regulator/antitoxin MqsA
MEPAELLRLRKRLKLTQAQLAERLGVTTVAVWRWEKGQKPGSRRRIPEPVARLLRLLVSYPDLMAEVMIASEPAPGKRRSRARRAPQGA